MKITMQIANGYRTRIAKIMTDDPTINELDATTKFIREFYGTWITENISEDYLFERISRDDFVVDFTYEDDARHFLRKVGGRAIEEA